MRPEELEENGRRLDLIRSLIDADAEKVARALKSKIENECADLARQADQIGHRDVGALIWAHVRKMGAPP